MTISTYLNIYYYSFCENEKIISFLIGFRRAFCGHAPLPTLAVLHTPHLLR